MLQDLCSDIKVVRGLSPVVATDNTALVSQIVDTAGYESLTWIIQTGTLADADATFAVTMHHGDASDLSDAAAVTSDDLIGTLALASFTFADDNKQRKLGYKGTKRYVRLTITPSNNTGDAPIAVAAILGHPRLCPQSTQGT
jgi:hypothetical protein